MSKIVLGLDQSSRIGWAVGAPGAPPHWGTWHVPDYGGNDGRTFWAVVDWLGNFIKSHGVTHVFWEQVWIPQQAKLNTNNLFRLVSIANAIQAACVDPRRGLDIEDRYVTPSEWRFAFLGHAKGGRDFLKQEAMAACQRRTWAPKNDHEAEALGIWEFGCGLLQPKNRKRQRDAAAANQI